jgi:hypothetical protein
MIIFYPIIYAPLFWRNKIIIASTIYCVWLRLRDFKWDYEEMAVSSELLGTRLE